MSLISLYYKNCLSVTLSLWNCNIHIYTMEITLGGDTLQNSVATFFLSGVILRNLLVVMIFALLSRIFLDTLLCVASFIIERARITSRIKISVDFYPSLRITLKDCCLTVESLLYGTTMLQPYFPISFRQISADVIVLKWDSLAVCHFCFLLFIL